MGFQSINLIYNRWVFLFSLLNKARKAWSLLLVVKSVNTQCNLKRFNERYWINNKIIPWRTEVNKDFSSFQNRELPKNYFFNTKKIIFCMIHKEAKPRCVSTTKYLVGSWLSAFSAGLTIRSELTAKKTNTCTVSVPWGHPRHKPSLEKGGRKEAERHTLGSIWHMANLSHPF